ncbi:MAG TPA: glycosyltransferase family 4 protein [Usitatibacter sp.]|nr:glycosyltransferase family 4 protein [Usitatibacter sp.]
MSFPGRLAQSGRPRLLMVSHEFGGGGVGRHVSDLARAMQGEAEVLLLHPHRISYVALRSLGGAGGTLWLRKAEEWDTGLLAVLRAIGIDRIHFHHVHNFPQRLLALARELAAPYDVTLHDFFPACPEYHFMAAGQRFCGAPADCHHCTEIRAPQWPLSVDGWRQAFGPWLAGAARVIAPSRQAARHLGTFFPSVSVATWPHGEDETPAAPAVRVLVPGAISPEKGVEVLAACVADANERRLPLFFRVLGYTSRPIAPWPAQPYSVSGEYPEGRLPELLAQERGDAIFFPAQCPETFSYTLSAALDTGLPIVATDLGAFPERLERHPGARIVPWNSSAQAFNDALVAAAPARPAPQRHEDAVPLAAYAGRLASALPGSTRGPQGPMPHLEKTWIAEPHEPKPPWTLAALYDDAVGCGRGSSLELLKDHAAAADRILERLGPKQ